MQGPVGSILDVAIVLSALYVALSCVCSFVNEQIAAVFRLRGHKLYLGVLNLLGGTVELADGIFAHPLVASASNARLGLYRKTTTNRPSYVDARNFSMAFWQNVAAGKAGGTVSTALDTVVTEPAAFLAALHAATHAIPDATFRQTVGSLLVAAGDDYAALLDATDRWFDAQMASVSGWYRRQTQYVLIGIAVVVVAGTGLDSIEIGQRLYATPIALGAASASIASAFTDGRTDPVKLNAAYANVLASEDARAFVHPFFHDFARHFAGMLATLVALSLGAPFWFDTLGRVVNVRMAGARPKRAGDDDR